MSILNQILRLVFDAILYPFRTLPPSVGLAVISAVVGVVMLLIFKHTSNQDALAAVKAKIHAGLFEIRLYNDDIRAILRAVGDIFRYNFFYIGHAVKPMLWMLPPVVPTWALEPVPCSMRATRAPQPGWARLGSEQDCAR